MSFAHPVGFAEESAALVAPFAPSVGIVGIVGSARAVEAGVGVHSPMVEPRKAEIVVG